jgi:hypothetical protein
MTGSTVNDGTSEDDDESDISEKVQKFNIDYLDEDELYPVQAGEALQADGLIKRLTVVTSDDSIALVTDPGKIKSTYSYGVAKINTAQKSGDLMISTSIKGFGSSSFQTKVVNSLELAKIKLFSPTGESNLLFERDGSFDMFLVALDSSSRPKILDFDEKFLITPTNSLIELEKGSTFKFANLQSDSFSIKDGDEIGLSVSPIGEDANTKLSSNQKFMTQLSSKLEVLLPAENVNVENINPSAKEGVGIVRLIDLQGNPIVSSKDLKVKLVSSNRDVVLVNDSVTLEKGNSFGEFSLDVSGAQGISQISASAKGVMGDSSKITASSTASSLSVFTSGLVEPIPVQKEIQLTIFVDDDNADSVAGAKVFIKPNENATTTVDLVRTGPDGSATFGLTAITGPEISIDFTLQAEGYIDGDETLDILVDHDPSSGAALANLELPPELIYVIIGGIVVVAIVVALFLKKSKEPIEEEEEFWEEEDI